jgi:glutathione synthase/RimK-type ligase-like ATP-grasp enzyme
MPAFDITLLTDSRYAKPASANWYVQNILEEDRLLTAALEKKGFRVYRTNWDNPDFGWSETRFAVFRTTWDYFNRFAEFNEWLATTDRLTHFINPLETIRWNLDKHYLTDLEKKGIRIPPTIFIEPKDDRPLQALVSSSGWQEVVLKPAVSGAARHTYRFFADESKDFETVFRELIAEEAMLLQQFQAEILARGEISLMLFDGKFSHAVVKKAKAGDYRVQDDFGGSAHDYLASEEEIRFAEHVVASCHPLPVYARVDLIWDQSGQLCVSELELIEPELWMRKHQPAADYFAEALRRYIEQM